MKILASARTLLIYLYFLFVLNYVFRWKLVVYDFIELMIFFFRQHFW